MTKKLINSGYNVSISDFEGNIEDIQLFLTHLKDCGVVRIEEEYEYGEYSWVAYSLETDAELAARLIVEAEELEKARAWALEIREQQKAVRQAEYLKLKEEFSND